MTHIGMLCPPAAGHLNPMTALGHELQRRGHQVTVFGVLDAQPRINTAGLDFCALGQSKYPMGIVQESLNRLGDLRGLAALIYTIKAYKEAADVVLREAPGAIKAAGVEAMVVDQSTFEGRTIAEFLNLPLVTICCALMLNPEPDVPPSLTSWEYTSEWWGRLRNQLGYSLLGLLGMSLAEVVNEYRRQWDLPLSANPSNIWSELAQISQQPLEFEFPRHSLPKYFHFVGPLSNPASRESVPFPFEKLTGQPLIYASMGTVQNRLVWVFEIIAKACEDLDAQLIISLGSSLEEQDSLPNFPGSPLVVRYAPQLELLKKATITITHAGLNTTLESLSNGVPMVAIPIANDQPGVAARIAWTGTGEVVPLDQLSTPKLRAAITKVLSENSYKNNALRLKEAIHRAQGVEGAADIVEKAISTGKPVLSL